MDHRIIIHNTDMNKEMQTRAIHVASYALDQFQQPIDVAGYIKQYFDRTFYPAWHCIVGKQFGSCFSYQIESFINFSFLDDSVLLYKLG
ncbi:Cytoplasmic dynein light chain [Fasciola hepatica]|uniref:Dynein light chain n=1 Tax=Fasciola hepatica TaxID=6192 RepID=A0A4E0RM88_FASHE|nr:Cytoplasmic dynein light chain [Fasciola hepatica]